MFEVNDGDKEIAPEYVMHDGRFTYLIFPSGVTDKPAVFRVVDGKEGRVNTRTVGRFGEVVVIEAMGDFVLRSPDARIAVTLLWVRLHRSVRQHGYWAVSRHR